MLILLNFYEFRLHKFLLNLSVKFNAVHKKSCSSIAASNPYEKLIKQIVINGKEKKYFDVSTFGEKYGKCL